MSAINANTNATPKLEPVDFINCAVRFYKSGFAKGEEYGLRVQAHNTVFQG